MYISHDLALIKFVAFCREHLTRNVVHFFANMFHFSANGTDALLPKLFKVILMIWLTRIYVNL
jgi:hypothetical protein